LTDRAPSAVPLQLLAPEAVKVWRKHQSAAVLKWLDAHDFAAKAGQLAVVPGKTGIAQVVAVIGEPDDPLAHSAIAARVPAGTYRLTPKLAPQAATAAAIGWSMAAYRFTRYKQSKVKAATLVWPEGADRALVQATVEANFLARDLINTPASDMGPAELAEAALALARQHGAKCKVVVGEDLLKQNWPMVHAVGRASSRAPRLIDMVWGPPNAPKVTLVGKGVCFDSGGLDLKPAGGMLLMKKDMGGAAHVLALASMIMATKLKLRLRVLVPAVENSVSGDAFRPLDVLNTRKGITVEIGNTDAEGRLILGDALHEAASEKPALIIDCATLTGAARVALGPELPAVFVNNDQLANDLLQQAQAQHDPLWRLPLWRSYRRFLDSKVADMNNVGGDTGGAITAALFLEEFVPRSVPWVHMDVMAWNASERPGQPVGAAAQGLRAFYALIRQRLGV
jgi:leucyl aminopeptidase